MERDYMKIIRENVKPYTREQMDELEKNTFQSPYSGLKEFNGLKFKVLYEHFDDENRESLGNEYSAGWIDETNGEIYSERFFEIELENGKVINAEREEISNYYIETNQI